MCMCSKKCNNISKGTVIPNYFYCLLHYSYGNQPTKGYVLVNYVQITRRVVSAKIISVAGTVGC